jgi:hypothetical protein
LGVKNNQSREFWTDERRALLSALAASGMAASEIGTVLGATRLSIIQCCSHRGIDVVTYTAAERTAVRAVTSAREKRKQDRRRKPSTVRKAAPVKVRPGTAQSSPIYRNQLPRIGEISKDRMREMIAQAVRNTAEMVIA